jgi:ADP-ribosylation factor GTPase-activating protein 2/3
MKVAGNASFTEFLARHPGSYYPNSNDAKAKYESRTATLYREELKRRVQEDEARFGPGKVVLEGVATEPVLSPSTNPDDDFFDSWDKPAAPKPTTINEPKSPPLLSLSANGSRSASRTASPAPPTSTTPVGTSSPPVAAPAPQPRTISSSSLRSTPSAAGQSSNARTRLGAQRAGGGGGGGGGAKSKLGAKKGAAINFEEAERKAREEEERIKRLGYDSKREQEEAAAAASASAATTQSPVKAVPALSNAPIRPVPGASDGARAAAAHGKKESVDLDRLGMGMRRLGFGQVSGMSGEEAAKLAEKERKAAQRRANGYDDDDQGK